MKTMIPICTAHTRCVRVGVLKVVKCLSMCTTVCVVCTPHHHPQEWYGGPDGASPPSMQVINRVILLSILVTNAREEDLADLLSALLSHTQQ